MNKLFQSFLLWFSLQNLISCMRFHRTMISSLNNIMRDLLPVAQYLSWLGFYRVSLDCLSLIPVHFLSFYPHLCFLSNLVGLQNPITFSLRYISNSYFQPKYFVPLRESRKWIILLGSQIGLIEIILRCVLLFDKMRHSL